MLPSNSRLQRLVLVHFLLELQFWFPVWLLFLTGRGFDLTTIVLADGVFRFTIVVFEVPLGILGDKIGHRRAYLLVALMAFVSYLFIALIVNVPMLFGAWILWGIFWAMASGSTSAYAYELIVKEGYKDKSLAIFGTLRATANFAALLSQLVAGFMFIFMPALPFVVSAVLALVAFALIWTLPEVGDVQDKVDIQHFKFANIRKVLNQPQSIRITVVLLAMALVFYWSPRILMQPLFIELSLTPMYVSGVYFFYSLAGILAGLNAERLTRVFNRQRAIFGGIFLIWMGVILVSLMPGYWSLMWFPLLGFGYFLSSTVLEVDLHHQVGSRNRATMLSAVSFVAGIVIMFARPALGVIADRFDAQNAFGAWAIIGIGVLILFYSLQSRTVSAEAAAAHDEA